MLTVSNLEEYTELVHSRQLVIAVFAGNDQQSKDFVAAIEKLETENPAVAFAEIKSGPTSMIATEYNVKNIPTAIFYNSASEVSRQHDLDGLRQGVEQLAALDGESRGTSAASATRPSASSKSFAKSINKEIDRQQLELLNVGSTGQDLFTTGNTTTVTDADDQLLAFVPFRNKVTVQGLHIKTSASGNRPVRIKVFTSLVNPLSFEDAASRKAQLDKELHEANSEGWIEVKVLVVNFKNVSSLLILLTGEDEDEPISVDRIEIVGKASEQTQGSLHDDHHH